MRFVPLLGLALACVLAARSADAVRLPDDPSPGLRLTVSVSCDFEERWWEATLHPGADLPLEVRSRTPSSRSPRGRERAHPITEEQRDELYALARGAFTAFRLDRRPDFRGPGSEREWTGERTITISALVLDDELGRVDRAEIAMDVMRGRSLPGDVLALVDAVAVEDTNARFGLQCR